MQMFSMTSLISNLTSHTNSNSTVMNLILWSNLESFILIYARYFHATFYANSQCRRVDASFFLSLNLNNEKHSDVNADTASSDDFLLSPEHYNTATHTRM